MELKNLVDCKKWILGKYGNMSSMVFQNGYPKKKILNYLMMK